MKIMRPPLELEDFFLSRINFDFNEVKAGDKIGDFDFQSTITQHATEALRWRVELSVQINMSGKKKKKNAVAGEICMVGFFTVNEEIPEDRRYGIIENSGCSILYASMRELFTLLSGQTLSGRHNLPAVSFVPDQNPTKRSLEDNGKK